MRIDPRYLESLLAIAKHGSFNRAAEARGISQPALSATISQLEHKLGVTVLERSRRGSKLTPYGVILVRHAQIIDAQVEQAFEEVRLRGLGAEGPLRVGATPSVILKFIPQVLERVSRGAGPLAISVAESLDDQLMPSLQCGDLDIVFGPLAGVFPAANDIIEVALFTDPLGLAVSPKSTVARRKSVSLNELKDAKWVLPGPGSAYRRQIEALFATTGLSWPTDCITTNSLTLTEYLITHSDRVSIVSRMQTVLFNAWHIRRVRLKGVGSRTIGVKWRKSMQLSPLAEQLLHAAREVSRADEALHGER